MKPLKKYYSTLLFVLLASDILAQSSIVSFIKTVPKKSYNNTKDSVIIYPIFRFKDNILSHNILSHNINRLVKYEFLAFYDQNKNVSLKKILDELAKNGLSELSYEELLNDRKFFSFALFHEWIASYPTYKTTYYVFDKETKNRITLDQLILPEKNIAFKNYITGIWKDSLSNYRQNLKFQLENKDIDSADYSTALEYIETDCLDSHSFKEFKLTKDTLEIFFSCGFPRIMLPIDPSGGIILPFKTISEYLRPKYRL